MAPSKTFPLGKVLLNHPPPSFPFRLLLPLLPARVVVVSPKNCGKEEEEEGGLFFHSILVSLFLFSAVLSSFKKSVVTKERSKNVSLFLLETGERNCSLCSPFLLQCPLPSPSSSSPREKIRV